MGFNKWLVHGGGGRGRARSLAGEFNLFAG